MNIMNAHMRMAFRTRASERLGVRVIGDRDYDYDYDYEARGRGTRVRQLDSAGTGCILGQWNAVVEDSWRAWGQGRAPQSEEPRGGCPFRSKGRPDGGGA
jgi:hypothetical protein